MKVLVIGANGRTGRLITQVLAQTNRYDVHGLIRQRKNNIPDVPNVTYHMGSVENQEDLNVCTRDKHVVIFAASSSTGWSIYETNTPYTVDYLGVRKAVNASVKNNVNKFILISSKGVTKPITYFPKFMLSALWGRIPHWKLMGENYLREQCRVPGKLTYCIVRPGNLDKDDNAFPRDSRVVFGQHDQFGIGSVKRSDVAHEIVNNLMEQYNNITFEMIRTNQPMDSVSYQTMVTDTHP